MWGEAKKLLKSPRQDYEPSGDATPVQTLVKYWNADRAGRPPKVEYKAGAGEAETGVGEQECPSTVIHGLETVLHLVEPGIPH